MNKYNFTSDFFWGTSTSTYQIKDAWNENRKDESNWDRWSHIPGKIKDGGSGDIAVDHYHRWKEDVEIMKELQTNAYVYITENRFAFEDTILKDGTINDDYRIDFIRKHIEACEKAIAEGVNLKKYFVWSLLDNFEWEMGWGQRFGLVYVDYKTLNCTIKKSGWWFRDLIVSQKGKQRLTKQGGVK